MTRPSLGRISTNISSGNSDPHVLSSDRDTACIKAANWYDPKRVSYLHDEARCDRRPQLSYISHALHIQRKADAHEDTPCLPSAIYIHSLGRLIRLYADHVFHRHDAVRASHNTFLHTAQAPDIRDVHMDAWVSSAFCHLLFVLKKRYHPPAVHFSEFICIFMHSGKIYFPAASRTSCRRSSALP